jgi:hypothetical protein
MGSGIYGVFHGHGNDGQYQPMRALELAQVGKVNRPLFDDL